MGERNGNRKKEPVADNHVCPVTFVLEILSCKWSIKILRELFIQPTRTRQFLARIPGLSMKVLRERLDMLEQGGLIDRNCALSGPKKVEYSLTAKGQQLPQVLVAIKELGEAWLQIKCTCSFECAGNEKTINCPARPQTRKEQV